MLKWNYVAVKCECGKESSIRIDQFNRKGKTWTCRSCAYTGRKNKISNPSGRHDPEKVGAWKSYWQARRRVRTNHKNAYGMIEFRFASFDQWFAELGPRPEGMSVDRINNDGHYEPGNVRWASQAMQNVNRGPRGRHKQFTEEHQ